MIQYKSPPLDELKRLIQVSRGSEPPDLVLRGCQLVSVHTREIYPADISISGARIAQVRPEIQSRGRTELDCRGLYALPGFIEPHMHVESTSLAPSEFARAVVPLGTTTVFLDPHEIGNVFGLRGVRELMSSARGLPLRVFLQVPSRVPSAPGLETTGGELDFQALKEMADWPETVSLGELDPSKVLPLPDEYLQRIVYYQHRNKIVNGHTGGLTGDDLNAYVAAGIFDDHNPTNPDELIERLRFGMTPLMVETTDRRMLRDLLKAVTERGLDTRHLCYDIDDKDVGAIVDEGFLDYNIKVALQAGIDPIRAVEMATLNPATHFGMDKFIGSLTPHRLADIVLVEEIGQFPPRYVLFEGQPVGQDGKMVIDLPSYDYPEWYKRSVALHPSFSMDRLRLNAATGRKQVTATVIVVSDQAVYNSGLVTELSVVDGEVQPDPERDILKLCAIERYGKNGNVAVAFVKGFGLKRGAIGSSVAHDHHNLMVVGCSDAEIMLAAQRLEEMNGGWVAVEGQEEIASMPMPLGGLMSDHPFEVAAAQRAELTEATQEHMGCALREPFPVLSFVGLPTVPEFGLSDMGLIDVAEKKLVNVVMS